jgi:putative membrane protein
MWTDALLAYAHLAAVLTWTVFLTSQTALLRPAWFNAAALDRLVRVERIASGAALAVLLTGLARLAFGPKGGWAWGQPLLWAKLAMFGLMAIEGLRAGVRLRGWQHAVAGGGALPDAGAVDALRKRVFRAAHLMVIVPLAAVLLARGILTR